MLDKKDRKSLKTTTTILFLIIVITYLITNYAKGYRLNLQKGISFQSTGILSATSKPKASSVYINDHLVTATDDTINLSPGEYEIKILKDGYTPWQKKIILKKETVFQTDAHLFRTVPDIRSITLSGAINPTVSLDNSKIIYAVASASASKNNGLYQYDLTDNLLPLSKNQPKQIATNFHNLDWSKFEFQFSPDNKEIIATSPINHISYLINLEEPIVYQKLQDITLNKNIILETWKTTESAQIQENFKKLPAVFKTIISTDSAKNILFSNENDKVLYLANSDYQLENNLIPLPPNQSTQKQQRQLKKDIYYVYCLKEDTNYEIGPKSNVINPLWLAGSNNIIYIDKNKIDIIEYDGTNKNTLFNNKFQSNFVTAKSDGSEIIIVDNNLYALNIR